MASTPAPVTTPAPDQAKKCNPADCKVSYFKNSAGRVQGMLVECLRVQGMLEECWRVKGMRVEGWRV